MPQAAAEGFQLPALVAITCPGLQLLPSAKAHGMRGDISRGMCCPLRHILGSSSVLTFYLGHPQKPWTQRALDTHRALSPTLRLTFHGCSFSLLQPWLAPYGFGNASAQGSVLKSSPQESSQRWQIRVVYVAMISPV